MRDFMGKPLFGGDRIIFTHSQDGTLYRGIMIKVNAQISIIRKCKFGTWEADDDNRYWSETRCSNDHIIKYEDNG